MALNQILINGQAYFTERATYESPVRSGQTLAVSRSHTINVILESLSQEQQLRIAANAGRVPVQLPNVVGVVSMFVMIESIEKVLYPKIVAVTLQEG
jgi:hypothetical protein